MQRNNRILSIDHDDKDKQFLRFYHAIHNIKYYPYKRKSMRKHLTLSNKKQEAFLLSIEIHFTKLCAIFLIFQFTF